MQCKFTLRQRTHAKKLIHIARSTCISRSAPPQTMPSWTERLSSSSARERTLRISVSSYFLTEAVLRARFHSFRLRWCSTGSRNAMRDGVPPGTERASQTEITSPSRKESIESKGGYLLGPFGRPSGPRTCGIALASIQDSSFGPNESNCELEYLDRRIRHHGDSPIRTNAPYFSCNFFKYLCLLPPAVNVAAQSCDTLASLGPGKFARGCTGETR